MDFERSDLQVDLQDGIRNLCQGRFDIDTVRSFVDQPGAVDRARWAELAEAGVFTLRVPEDRNGLGLGLADAALVYEELGRALVNGPLVGTALAAELDPARGAGSVVGMMVRPEPARDPHPAHPIVVTNLDALDVLLVLDDDGVHEVDPAPLRSQQGTRAAEHPLDVLTPVHTLDSLPQGDLIADAATSARFVRDGSVLTSALMLGISLQALDLSVAYAKEREQFGRPIGGFQAVKHLCADMVTRAELARAAVYAAAVTVDQPEVGSADRATASARVLAMDAATQNTRQCIQVHGGMGFTWELHPHLFWKRAWALETDFGSADVACEVLATLASG